MNKISKILFCAIALINFKVISARELGDCLKNCRAKYPVPKHLSGGFHSTGSPELNKCMTECSKGSHLALPLAVN